MFFPIIAVLISIFISSVTPFIFSSTDSSDLLFAHTSVLFDTCLVSAWGICPVTTFSSHWGLFVYLILTLSPLLSRRDCSSLSHTGSEHSFPFSFSSTLCFTVPCSGGILNLFFYSKEKSLCTLLCTVNFVLLLFLFLNYLILFTFLLHFSCSVFPGILHRQDWGNSTTVVHVVHTA